MEKINLSKNYYIIVNTFLKYLPSRLFIILNSLVIIPMLAYIFSEKEMGLFQLCIGILNLICTCSTDWIAKSTLRFWIKYKRKEKLDSFFSNVLLLTFVGYLIIIVLYILFSEYISIKFSINKPILLLTLFLIIPCGIRQLLYQMLRIFNKPFLYTFSIIVYQLSLLILFLAFSNIFGHTTAILMAMAVSIFFIDFYIIKQIDLNNKISFKLDKSMLLESLKYSLPLVVTNISIWAILNINKFVFQYYNFFIDTAMAGVCWFFTTNILAPMFSTFIFSVFPTIIKQFEKKRLIKTFITNTIQLYVAIFTPIVGLFCFFSKEITDSLLSAKYAAAHILLPFFALSIFGHELLKLLNIKYHLRNKTYIEMGISLLIGLICIVLNIILIPKIHILAAGFVMLFSIILLIIANSMVKFKSINYLEPEHVFKTAITSTIIAILVFVCIDLTFKTYQTNNYFIFVKMLLFIAIYYLITWQFRAKILE